MGSVRWVVAGLGVGAAGGFLGGLARRIKPLATARHVAPWTPGGPAVPLRATIEASAEAISGTADLDA